ncbi:MAG: hypothetical protein ACOX2A_09065 [Tepidanaerobacteraceae bacterium]
MEATLKRRSKLGLAGIWNVSIEEDPWHTRPQDNVIITMPSIPGVDIYAVDIFCARFVKN